MMTSGRNDYSACSTWLVHKNDAYLIHVYRGRLEYPDLRRKVIGLAAEHRATPVLIEDAGPGMNLLQDLRAMPGGMTRPIGVIQVPFVVSRPRDFPPNRQRRA
jgi:phage terminase large subunit-like protein